jgi:PAS domain S-box-containing protein
MSKGSILIIEDSFIIALHLQTTLESDGYTVVGKFDSGEACLQYLESNKPDIVLMDIMLNGTLDGIETAHVINTKYHLPVIYITALTDKNTVERAKITQPYGYLTKPFEDREIFTVIEMALYKHRVESQLRQSELRYFSTVSSISDAVIVIDTNFRITYMNPSAEKLTGYSLQHVRDLMLSAILRLKSSEDDSIFVNPAQCPVGHYNRNGMPDDLVLIANNDSERPIGESSFSPIFDNKEKCIGLIIIFRDLTEKREHERIKRDLEKQRLAALIEGQEKERNRIAKDLHDGLGQMLNAIKMNTNMLIKDRAEASVLFQLMDEAIQESVRISENLLPSKLKDFDLSTCMRSLCKQMNNATGIPVNFTSSGSISPLNQFQKINFYRIGQEAITNAIKHAKPTAINVQLTEDFGHVRLSIEDDGIGVGSREFQDFFKNNGMVNMRERAEILGGQLTVESDKNRGTLIVVDVVVADTKNYVKA